MSEETNNQPSSDKAREGKWVHGSKVLAIIAVLALGVLLMKYLKDHGPEADKEPPVRVIPVVRILEVGAGPEQLTVMTQGRVEPLRRTQAASEVMGRVIKVAPQFNAGGRFAHHEIMLELERADYLAALASAESSLADAKLLLEQEEARAQQASRDWQNLGRGKPSALVLRKPQIESAKARLSATEAAVQKATRDLERTRIRAPYDCLVEATYTDLGSYVVAGARLADLYSAETFEARVPVTLEELGYLAKDRIVGADVVATANLGGARRQWQGTVVRNEGVVDRETMTMYLVVSIKPNENAGQYRLPPAGLFVQAEIQGKKMENVIRIPRSALQADNSLLVLGADDRLQIVPVEIVRTLHKSVLISAGPKDGTRVIVSQIETPVPGMQLAVQQDAAPPQRATTN